MSKNTTYPDRPTYREEMYVDYDEGEDEWCVFGLESGHAYASFGDQESANSWLEEKKVTTWNHA